MESVALLHFYVALALKNPLLTVFCICRKRSPLASGYDVRPTIISKCKVTYDQDPGVETHLVIEHGMEGER